MTRPVRAWTSASWPSARRRAHTAEVRRSCQTMARWIGIPVARSQTTTVSRWLVMPMPATSAAVRPAFARASRTVATTPDQMSSGSCSTQPEAGKCCGNSCCATASTAMSGVKTMAREEVVPWSIATITVLCPVPAMRVIPMRCDVLRCAAAAPLFAPIMASPALAAEGKRRQTEALTRQARGRA